MRLFLLLIVGLCVSTAALAQSCSVAATPLNFGTYTSSTTSAHDTTAYVTVNCSGIFASHVIQLNAGANSGGSFSNRRMSDGRDYLVYQLYDNTGRTTVWGNGSGGTATISMNSSGTATIYGRLPAKQNVSAGAYADTILVTVSF